MKNVIFRGWGRRSFALGLLVLLGCVASLPARAGDSVSHLRQREQTVSSRQNRLQSEIRRANHERTGLLARIAALDASRAATEAQVQKLDSDIAGLDSRIAATHDQLRASNRRLARLSDQLQSTLRKLDARTQAFASRAVASYEAGPTGGLDALLSSQSFGQLMDRYTYYQAALSTDTDLIGQIQKLRDEIEGHRSAVESQQKGILAARAKLQADRSTVAHARSRKRTAIASLRTLISQKHSAVAHIDSKKAQLHQAIAENARESAQIESLLQAAMMGPSGSTPAGGGQLLWPAVGPITSPFGWRIHPIFGTREFHTGIDIGAPYGATVSAADAGTVDFAGTMSGYGNVVVIDHGGGLATLYGHLSAYRVSVGQSVARGAPIANVGCTGWCTGAHLHFEVRLSGQPVDPMPYLQ
jgi:murein DD-endopeptidase MepM/ murein hydrolase activator NlpD